MQIAPLRSTVIPVLVVALGLCLGAGCSDQEAARITEEAREVTASGIGTSPVGAEATEEEKKKRAAAEETAEELKRNVEDSAATLKDTYEKERAAGEGVVESASDAYEAVEKKAE